LVFSLTQPAKITDTSIYHEIPKVFTGNRQLLADNAILKQVLEEIERIVCKRKKLILKGKTMVSILKVFDELKKCIAKVNLKKSKQKPRQKRN